MKKIFTLIAAAFMAVSANAQSANLIQFTEAATAGSLNGKEIKAGDLTLKITDNNSKVKVESNSQYFGTSADNKVNFTFRMSTGGKSSSNNQMTLTAAKAGTLTVYARTGSSSATDRNIVLTQGDTKLVDHIMLESESITETYENDGSSATRKIYAPISTKVVAGDIVLTYPTNTIYFYAFDLDTSTSTGISEVSASAAKAVKAKKVVKNGRLVIETAAGEFSVSGARVK